jgi:hypothetical protein
MESMDTESAGIVEELRRVTYPRHESNQMTTRGEGRTILSE